MKPKSYVFKRDVNDFISGLDATGKGGGADLLSRRMTPRLDILKDLRCEDHLLSDILRRERFLQAHPNVRTSATEQLLQKRDERG